MVVFLQDLTVGQVSGMIAAAVFVVQFLVPVALPVILVGLLRPRSSVVTESAVSWSVIGRFLQSSLWPVFLRTDSAATTSSCKPVLFMSFFKTFMMALIAVAAVVTPLGLYEGIVAEPTEDTAVFHYIRDPTPMGYGTPPRSNNTWNRICGSQLVIPCPNDNNRATVIRNTTGYYVSMPSDIYDTSIPKKVLDVWQSGSGDLPESVSNSFDIQYRSYVKALIEDTKGKNQGPQYDDGTARTVGTYQPLSSLVLNEQYMVIEGLVVDMKNGGIGFRNHTAPTQSLYGSTWDEDILFVVPETVCVNTNLTLDFRIAATRTESLNAKNGVYMPELVDHGGFVNINKTYPAWTIGDTQTDPSLYYRAYRAAWLSNAWSMAFMNVTTLTNETAGTKAFSYLNSTVGKRFPLYFPSNKTATNAPIQANSLSLMQRFGDYLGGTEGLLNTSTIGNVTKNYTFESTFPIYPNTAGVTSYNWTTISTLCRGQGNGDYSNITNIAGQCGFLYGAPLRKDDKNSSMFDPGSAWSLPMYTCTSSVKAIVKTVSFRFNGTKDDLSALEILSLTDKKYPNDDAKPLWAVENSNLTTAEAGSALWGIISKDNENKLNMSTVRREHLYLPGRDPGIGFRNIPGADFAPAALYMTYSGSSATSSTPGVDYSGKVNLAMYKKWQELSKTPETSARIINLIWTDIAANMVVGTKSLAPESSRKQKRDTASTGNKETPPVVNYTRRVRYKYPYGIPAFLALVLIAAAAASTSFFVLFSGARPAVMKSILQHTSAGRLLTAQAQSSHGGHSTPTSYRGHSPIPGETYSNAPTDVWAKGAGQQEFTLGAEGWMKSVQHVPGYENKGGANAVYAPVPNAQGY